uniref:DNA methyltransferase n=1 Tax=Lactococcus lactis TaxID=1358 RepID=UPI0021A30DD5|nr:DNA methyltransferase [Lactococcus lactis]
MIELNKIYNEDCLEGMKRIPDNSVDLIVTDPPYLMRYKTNHRKNKNHKFSNEILNDNNHELIQEYIKECHRIMKGDTAMYMFCSMHNVDFFKKRTRKIF